MAPGMVPIKTAQGHAELAARRRGVSQRHRTVLFFVDGRRNAETVRNMARDAGVPANCFDDLLSAGLIMLVEPTFSMLIDLPLDDSTAMHVDLPLFASSTADTSPGKLLPASRSMFSESTTLDTAPGVPPVAESSWLPTDVGGTDIAFVEARLILARAVRAEAPLAGSLTLLRLRRARTRADLLALLDEVEQRISKPHRTLAATLTMRRVRGLLDGRLDSRFAPA